MIFENPAELKDRITELTGRKVYGRPQVFEDTSSYMAIYGGCVVRLWGNDYFVMGDTKEGRFGIDDQPKFWVKYAVDLTDGAHKIIKLVFHEQFSTNIGPITVRCTRSPQKESRFLDLVRGDMRFMQGHTVLDPSKNRVRIIDFIRGPSFFNTVAKMEMDHETYFFEVLPRLMDKLAGCIDAMAWVHQHDLDHGDIRNDHIIVEADTSDYIWIDFDYGVNFLDYDVWSMGNVVTYAVAKGIVTYRAVNRDPGQFPARTIALDEHDVSAFYPYRVANLGKLYPYIPQDLNDILMRFSIGAIDFYDDLSTLAEDLREVFGLVAP